MEVRRKWTPEIQAFVPSVEGSGVEDLTIQFPWTPVGKHLREEGFNGIFLHGCAHCWARNVNIINPDSGIIAEASFFSTATRITLGVTKTRGNKADPYEGHIGLAGSMFSSDLIFTNFTIKGRWRHDLTARGAARVAFSGGSGTDLNMDGHRRAPYGILFHNIRLGAGLRPFSSGGKKDSGRPFGTLGSSVFLVLFTCTGPAFSISYYTCVQTIQ